MIIEGKEKTAAVLDKKTEKAQKQLDVLETKTAATEKVVVELEEIEKLGHKRTITGAVTIPANFWTKILNLIKEAFKSRKTISDLRKKVNESAPTIAALERELAQEKKAREAEKPRLNEFMDFNMAKYRAPKRMAAVIADIKRSPAEWEQPRTDRTNTTTKKISHEI